MTLESLMMSNRDHIPIQTIKDTNRMSNWDETLKKAKINLKEITSVPTGTV